MRRVYICRTQGDATRKRGCGGVRRIADALEDLIVQSVIYRLDTPELAKLLNGSGDKAEDAQLRELFKEQEYQRRRIDGFVDALAEGLLDEKQFARANLVGKQKLAAIDKQISALSRHLVDISIPAGQTVREAWDKAQSDEWRRSLLALLIKRIELRPGITKPYYYAADGTRYRFDPSLVDVIWAA